MITIETQEIIGDREFEQSFLVDRKNHIIKSTIKMFYDPFVEMNYLNLTHFRSGSIKISHDLLKNLENKNLITYTDDKRHLMIDLYKIIIKFIDNTTETFTFYEKEKAYKAYDILLKSFKNGL